MHLLRLALGALLLAVPTACDNSGSAEPREDSSSSEPFALPENLCSVLSDSVIADFSFVEDAHETTSDVSSATATCAMTGRDEGVVDLDVTVGSYGGTDPRAAKQEGFDEACAAIAAAPGLSPSPEIDDDETCAALSDADRDGFEVRYVSQLENGVAYVRMESASGNGLSLIPAAALVAISLDFALE